MKQIILFILSLIVGVGIWHVVAIGDKTSSWTLFSICLIFWILLDIYAAIKNADK